MVLCDTASAVRYKTGCPAECPIICITHCIPRYGFHEHLNPSEPHGIEPIYSSTTPHARTSDVVPVSCLMPAGSQMACFGMPSWADRQRGADVQDESPRHQLDTDNHLQRCLR